MVGQKYTPIAEFLAGQPTQTLSMTFKKCEEIIGTNLPSSARKYNEWWSGATPHRSQETAWLSAGWKVDSVDIVNETVIFVRV